MELTNEEAQAKYIIMKMAHHQVPSHRDKDDSAQLSRSKRCALDVVDIIIDAIGPIDNTWHKVKKAVVDYNIKPVKHNRV